MKLIARLGEELRSNSIPPIPDQGEIPTQIYLDKNWLERERSTLFEKAPIIIGHVSMLTKPGDRFTHDHLGKPLLVVLGNDSKIRVFYNVCRHRGMRLVNEEGVKRKAGIICPYHNWAYGLDGTLNNVPLPEGFEGVDLSCRNLKQVPSEVRHGFIWVQLDETQPLDLDAHLGEIAVDLDVFETDQHYVFRQSATHQKTNWKLIVEAFLDGYHVIRLHKKTIGAFFMDAQGIGDVVGRNIRSLAARAEFPETLDLPPEQWDARNHATFAYFIFPNTTIIIHPDYISTLTLFPVETDETIAVHMCLIPSKPKTDKEQAHWERAFDIIENGVFQAEDFFVCEGAQKGMASGANSTLLIGAYESGIAQFHDILRDVLGPFEN